MKRAIALLLALVMTMCMVAACGDNAGTTPTTEPTVATGGTTAGGTTTTPTTATTKKPSTPTGPKTATQAETAPVETTGKGPFLWLDFEPANVIDTTDKNGNPVKAFKNVAGTEGLNAIITGNPAYITSPTGADAVHFGQTKGSFDYLTIANDDRINFTTSDEFTVDFWYMLDRTQPGTWCNLFSKGSSKNGWYGVWLAPTDGNNGTGGGVCWGGDTGNYKVGSVFSKYQWHHITVIQKSGILFMYLNGKKVNETGAVNCTSLSDLFIGGRNSSDASPNAASQFHGAIDEFKIYDYAWDIEVNIKPIYTSKFGTFEYVNPENSAQKMTLPYRVYLPTDYETSTKEYPILLFLHGHGECGTDNSKQLQVFGNNVFLDDIAAMDNCIILAPQTFCDGATNQYEWVASGSGIPGVHQWDGSAGGLKIREGNLEDITHTVGMQAAEALLKKFLADNASRIDENRIYVGGISMGGCGTWEIIARNPELFAAAVPLCGSGILSTAPSLVNIDIWAFHGVGDKTVWTEGTAKMVEAIKAAGGTKIIYTEIAANYGHSIWNPSYTYKNANGETPAQWLLKQTKAD